VTSDGAITSAEGLRDIYRQPGRPAIDKVIDHLDENCRVFLAHSPFLTMATSDADGRCDVSPKGGPPGFVVMLDEKRLAIPDLSGNNRLDSLQNLVGNPGIGLLFFVPGMDETLRVNGTATVTTAGDVLDACALRDVRPKVAIVVDVEEVYLHCAKALRRAALWRSEEWPDISEVPSAGCIYKDHIDLDVPAETVDQLLEDSYLQTLWRPGGE
jgi:PPOX class probable FMN-dependent enzyme